MQVWLNQPCTASTECERISLSEVIDGLESESRCKSVFIKGFLCLKWYADISCFQVNTIGILSPYGVTTGHNTNWVEATAATEFYVSLKSNRACDIKGTLIRMTTLERLYYFTI